MSQEDILFDMIEGEEVIHPVSGEENTYTTCVECKGTNGNHVYDCSSNHDLYDEIEALLEHPITSW